MDWNPTQYTRFEQERSAPFVDTLALLRPRSGIKAIDLGCGTGALTAQLTTVFPQSSILGIDSSPEMLAQATTLIKPGLSFRQQAIEEVEGRWDVVFSHAAIQWLPDHERLLQKLWNLVAPGGQLVVQLPSNHKHVSHTLMRDLASEEPFYEALGGWVRDVPVLSVARYAELLWELGGKEITIYEKVYPHVFDSADQIVEWVRGTALLPYVQRLPEQLRDGFVEHYRERLRGLLPTQPVFYGFRRILWSALKEDT